MNRERGTPRVGVGETDEAVALSERAFQYLRERILTGDIRPGTVLSEARLADELGMSRTPIREALLRLATDGFVQRFLGRGAIVQELGLQEILDVFEVQACLEEYALQRVIEGGREIDVASLEAHLRTQEAAADAGEVHTFLAQDRAMHLRLLQHLENERLTQIMRNASDLMIYAGYRALRSPAHMWETIEEHRAIVRALLARDLPGALAASRAHIDGAKRRLLA